MKESDITPRIIELSKEIAKYWRMEIYEGCWFSLECDLSPFLFDNWAKWCKDANSLLNYNGRGLVIEYKKDKWFPIPSISDCLEKLKHMRFYYDIASYRTRQVVSLAIYNPNNIVNGMHFESESLHEALLSALLEVLKEKSEIS